MAENQLAKSLTPAMARAHAATVQQLQLAEELMPARLADNVERQALVIATAQVLATNYAAERLAAKIK